MKRSLLFFLILFSSKIFSQTLTQSGNEPVVGDLEQAAKLDSSKYTSGMPNNVSGNNVVWDFTKLIPDIVTTNTYNAPSSSEQSTYPGCNLVQRQVSNSVTYLKSSPSSSQTEMLGVITNTATTNSLNMKFSNSAIIFKYPSTFGSTHTDQFNGSYSGFGFNGSVTGTITTTADGTGTLNLPSGKVFMNVLRMKSVQYMEFTLQFATGIFAVGVNTTYNYYHSSLKFPILSMNYQTLTLSGGTPSISAVIYGNPQAFSVGLDENELDEEELDIYPNPTNNSFTFAYNNTSNLVVKAEIYNLMGEKVKEYEFDANSATLQPVDVADFKKGIYTVMVRTRRGSAIRKLVIE
jgi:hypothetical protein